MTTMKKWCTSNGIQVEVEGEGPPLLILQSGHGVARSSEDLNAQLDNSFSVVTYDRRGLSGSSMIEGPATVSLAQHAEDACEVLSEACNEPAFILGSSIGATIGLELLARCAERVRLLVAHEPPVTSVLAGTARAQVDQLLDEVGEVFRERGTTAAMQFMARITEFDLSDMEPGVRMPVPSDQRLRDFAFYVTNDVQQCRKYSPDIVALQSVIERLVLAGGRNSRHLWTYQCTDRLASLLEVEIAEFPGRHNGLTARPRATAEAFRALLTDH